ncbi:hypothetical protein [Sphaerisporangium sp. NPDC051011]|uniref:hypothetical protein n=1 Tax=Sphaerisporangium sp. NPDC051011 TaxID=3155792 RepID=UPI0033DF87E9
MSDYENPITALTIDKRGRDSRRRASILLNHRHIRAAGAAGISVILLTKFHAREESAPECHTEIAPARK